MAYALAIWVASLMVAASLSTGNAAFGPGTLGCPPTMIPAVGTLYDSWPKPGTKECCEYDGCKNAGQFTNIDPGPCKGPCEAGAQRLSGGGGCNSNPNVCCRWPEEAIARWSIAATWDSHKELLNRKLQITVLGGPAGNTATVNVKDTCANSDCKDCCAKNTGDGKYLLIDIEKWPGGKLLKFDHSSPKFDINDVDYPTHNGKRPGAPSGVMALCYKDVGPADKIPNLEAEI